MKILPVLALVTAVSTALASAPVAAQEHAVVPTPQVHAFDPACRCRHRQLARFRSRCGRTTLPA